ncbi:P-loop containing nucleoside triphosphate hydrolase [Vibrio phage vB_VpaM_R16F]|nr:P-loop containing nucleoside triphosphate hydrolase [Vibrio phage vB_VpaM_R16F]
MIDWDKFNNIINGLPFKLTDEQKETFTDIVTNDNHQLVIGKPGVGKSVLIDVLQQYLGDKMIAGSTTGISNQRLFNGKGGVGSMHRIFSLPTVMHNDSHKKKVTPFTSKLLSSNYELEYILIDECGFLLNADLIELIFHRIDRFNRKYKDRPRRNIKLILVGDLAQLPIFFDEKEGVYMQEKYGSPYFFKTDTFRQRGFKVHALKGVNRTKDKTFLAGLDVMRFAEKDRYNGLCRWVNNVMHKDIIPDNLPVMTCWNREADRINEISLARNPNQEWIYYAEVDKKFDMKNCPSGEFVKLKVGAKIMTLINDNESGEYSNGSMGEVTQCDTQGCWVRFDHTGREVYIEKHLFEKNEPFEAGTTTNSKGETVPVLEYKVIGSCLAMPISLAYGLSVHKNQGATIQSPCVVDLGRKGFNSERFGPALAYVALSRFSNPNDVYLKYPLTPNHIWVNQEILDWIKQF